MLLFKILGRKDIIRIDEKKDFIFCGGEANIYSYKTDVLKIYHDKDKMVSLDKIKELSELDKNYLIKPKDILLDKNDEIVGFTMINVDTNTLPIMRLFNTKFWKQNKLNINKIIKIVEFIQETLIYIHKKDCLIVDFNDTNFLINDHIFSIVYFLDMCSWKTKSFLPTAISPFVKDYSNKNFDELTDWFSCAILFFQLITGVHPFRGTHPKYGIKKEDTIQRMKENASVYDKGVTVNSAIRLSIIPSNYNEWFRNLFLYGKREFPPGTAGVVTAIKIDRIISKENLLFNIYKEFDNELIDYKYVLGKEIFIFKDSIKIDNKEYLNCKGNIIFDNELNSYEVEKENTFLTIKNLNKNTKEKTNIRIEDFFIIDNNLYCKNEGFVFHVQLKNMKRLLVLVNNKWSVMQHSSKIFSGIIYENIMGKCWFFIPIYQKNWGVSLPVSELDGYRIIDCERKKNILFVIGKKENELKRFIFKFNDNYDQYKIVSKKDNISDINFIVLENGIVVNIEEKEIEIFDSRFEKDKIKIVDGDIINYMIVNKGNEVLLIDEKKLMKITLK